MEKCPVCGRSKYTKVYDGPIRAGSYGKLTQNAHRVIECVECSLGRLETFVVGASEYESDQYREQYNDSSQDAVLLSMHDHEQPNRQNIMGLEKFRGKIVLDYGAGHGSFLDSISGIAGKTIAVEPFAAMHDSLRKRGHEVFSYAADATTVYKGKVDIVASFGVIEHVPNPSEYLTEAHELLHSDGVILLQTDNAAELLMQTKAKGFAEFYYRTAHNWYFNKANLERLFTNHGYSIKKSCTTHNYDFSNFLLWQRDGRPTGLGKEPLFDESFQQIWKAYVEKFDLGELITVIASKK